jgi:two-component system KDP operon response regulator KdpE
MGEKLHGESVSDLEGKRILLIDDDPYVLRLLEYTFSYAGAQVYAATGGQDGLRLLNFCAHRPDLVILDVMMPEMDGWEVSQRIRQISDVPIIFLSALGGEEDIIRGLEFGAVDYVLKPCKPEVLLARARSALRQAESVSDSQQPLTYRDDFLTIDLEKRRVLVRGKQLRLSGTEYRLLAYLLRNAGQVLTTQQILENVWGFRYFNSVNYIHAYVWQLRQKLEPNPARPRYLLAEQGGGYSFQMPPAAKTDQPLGLALYQGAPC